MTVIAPIVIGVGFGWLLERAGLTRYDRIVGVYRFTDLTVLKFLGSALAVGACALQALRWLGFASAFATPVTAIAANLLGGALFGIGMAGAGFCPGTIAAGAGAGQVDYLVAGVAGLFSGALLFGWAYSHFFPALARIGRLGTVTLSGLIGTSGGLIAVILLEMALLGFYAVERGVKPAVRPPRQLRLAGC
jgi:uncharacterized protein